MLGPPLGPPPPPLGPLLLAMLGRLLLAMLGRLATELLVCEERPLPSEMASKATDLGATWVFFLTPGALGVNNLEKRRRRSRR